MILFVGGCDSLPAGIDEAETEERVISLNIESPQSRSLSGTASETWEKRINTASIYVFNSTGKTVYVRALTTAEITAINAGTNMNVTFIVPGNITVCDIYVVANTTPSASISTKTSFLTSIEQDISNYNGTYALTTTSALRTNGFVMTGSQNSVTLSLSGPTTLPITLRRIVAKLAIEVNISALLTIGTSVVTTVSISQSAPVSNLFPLASGNTTGSAVTFNQTAQVNNTNNRQFFAFFYIYENDTRSLAANQVKLTFLVVNTLIVSTTYTYNVSLTGDGSGKMTRNRGYYVTANVNKLINLLLTRSSETEEGLTIEERVIY